MGRHSFQHWLSEVLGNAERRKETRLELIYSSTMAGLQPFTCSRKFNFFQFAHMIMFHFCYTDSAGRVLLVTAFVLFSSHFCWLTGRQRSLWQTAILFFFFFFPPNKPLPHKNIMQLLFLSPVLAWDSYKLNIQHLAGYKEAKLKSSGFRYYFRNTHFCLRELYLLLAFIES